MENICVIEVGGGCVYEIGVDPSLKVTVYVVPGGFDETPVIGNVKDELEHIKVLPGFPKLTAGLLPTKILYVEESLHDDAPPVTMKLKV